MLNVTIYNEYKHERTDAECAKVYPDGIHAVLADFIQKGIECSIRTFTVDDVNEKADRRGARRYGCTLWWGHMAHNDVSDETAERVRQHVADGMGAVFLHSGHHSKPFKS